jgi:hypothetical protein
MPARHLSKHLLLLVTILSIFTACGSSAQEVYTTGPLPGVPTITLDNTAPSNLDLDFVIVIDQLSPTHPKQLRIEPNFSYQSHLVKFIHGEKLVCGGISLANGAGIYTLQIPPAGTATTCAYNSPQGSTSFVYTVPAQITITSPAPGTTLTRSTSTQVTFSLLPNCQDVGVIIGSTHTDGSGSESSVDGGGCVATQTVNTLNEPAGPGLVGAVEVLRSPATNNPGFHSFLLNVRTTAIIPVTWK